MSQSLITRTHISKLFPITRNLNSSLHYGDWILYLSAIEWVSSLSFSFGKLSTVDGLWFVQDSYILAKSSHSFTTHT